MKHKKSSITVKEWLATKSKKKKNKYKATRVMVDNVNFHSKGEAARYKELKVMQQAGLIMDVLLQRNFDIYVNHIKVGTYIADFAYYHKGIGEGIVEDFKGHDTPLSRFKRKCVEAQYGIKIDIIRSNKKGRRKKSILNRR